MKYIKCYGDAKVKGNTCIQGNWLEQRGFGCHWSFEVKAVMIVRFEWIEVVARTLHAEYPLQANV